MRIRRVVPSAPYQPPRRRRRRWLFVALGVLALIGFFVLRPFWQLTGQFDELIFRQPSRLYGRAPVLQEGTRASIDTITGNLEAEGYKEEEGEGEGLPTGRFRAGRSTLTVHLRSFPLPDGQRGGGVVEVRTRSGRISSLKLDGQPVESVTLDPPLLASYYGPDLFERRPVTVDDVSEDLIAAVVAVEDANFFRHSGFSFSGTIRALWVNLRGGEVRQGGSTLTQQLVKNLYLTHERTLDRKGRELLLALMLELRYSKQEILEAYLNEIYLGRSGGVNLMGMGAASRAFFGKDAAQLDLSEAATLAGIIRAPGPYSPLAHPERAKERRDLVLRRLLELRRIDPARIQQALDSPLVVSPEPLVRRRAPYFADAMALEAQRRFGIDDLADSGYVLFSTLDWRDQQAAQKAVTDGVERAEKGYRKKGATTPLQAALVSVDAKTGGILAYVGGRSYTGSQFDRAGQALRQAGSAFKPVVYAAAFESGALLPASMVDDSPFTWRMEGKDWSPKNDDGSFHGHVTVRTALERSYNPATARIAQKVGIERIVALGEKMGLPPRRKPFPSLSLGASEVTPVELVSVYATLAAGGVRPPVHGLAAALDRYGKPVPEQQPLPQPKRVISAQTAYMVTSLLQGVFQRGTAAGAASSDHFAGKTGTTNKQRDSWFGAYSPARATVVWVGYDDNSSTRLSGARAALPIWTRFIAQTGARDGYRTFPQPKGITTAYIDPYTGKLATEFCPHPVMEVFPEDKAPSETCDEHAWYEPMVADSELGPGGDEDMGEGYGEGYEEEAAAEEARGDERERRHPFRRWLRKVFGNQDKDRDRQGEGEGNGEKPPLTP
jgi:penicillin-binding protein 1B